MSLLPSLITGLDLTTPDLTYTKSRKVRALMAKKGKKQKQQTIHLAILSQVMQTISQKITVNVTLLVICPFVRRFMPCPALFCSILQGPGTSRLLSQALCFWFMVRMDHWGDNDWRLESQKWENQGISPPFSLGIGWHLRQGFVCIHGSISLRPLSSGCGSNSSSLPLVSSMLLHDLWSPSQLSYHLCDKSPCEIFSFKISQFCFPAWTQMDIATSKFPPYAANTSSGFIFQPDSLPKVLLIFVCLHIFSKGLK